MYAGEIILGNSVIPCYVLEDGTRILSGRQMQSALKMIDEDTEADKTSGARLIRFLKQKSLKPYLYKENEPGHYDPILCTNGEQKINGYEATILNDICDAFLEARQNISLSSRQAIIAQQCEILVRGFARVGIIALIDEATGYQYDREREELAKILHAYISDEILRWQLTFTDDFYKQLFRLWGLPYIPKYIKGKPGFIGRLTSKFIYEKLPNGVLEKIKENIPRTEKGNYKYKFHQSLTPEVGRQHLIKQITEVTTLMSVSHNRSEFEDLFERKYGCPQLKLRWDEEDIN